MRVLVAGTTPAALSGCAGPLSALDPAGPRAAALETLWWVMFWGAVGLFILVIGLLALSYLRPALLRTLSPMQWLVGGGLLLPLPVLILLTGTALVLGEQLLPHREDEAPMRIEVEAAQWAWRFSYPDIEGAEPSINVVHMPAGEPVDFIIRSADVIHSFWIPRLGGKLDAIPGHTNILRLEADRPGTYWGICAEYCGTGHDVMTFRAEAHLPEALAQAVGGGQ